MTQRTTTTTTTTNKITEGIQIASKVCASWIINIAIAPNNTGMHFLEWLENNSGPNNILTQISNSKFIKDFPNPSFYCPTCGINLDIWGTQVSNYNRVFCSKTCIQKYWNK